MQTECFQRRGNSLPAFAPTGAGSSQTESEIAFHAQVWKEQIVLLQQADASLFRWQAGLIFRCEQHLSFRCKSSWENAANE